MVQRIKEAVDNAVKGKRAPFARDIIKLRKHPDSLIAIISNIYREGNAATKSLVDEIVAFELGDRGV